MADFYEKAEALINAEARKTDERRSAGGAGMTRLNGVLGGLAFAASRLEESRAEGMAPEDAVRSLREAVSKEKALLGRDAYSEGVLLGMRTGLSRAERAFFTGHRSPAGRSARDDAE